MTARQHLSDFFKSVRHPNKSKAKTHPTQNDVDTEPASTSVPTQPEALTTIPIRSFEILPTLLQYHASPEPNAGVIGTKGWSDIEQLQDTEQGAHRARDLVSSAVRAILSQKSPAQTDWSYAFALGQVVNDLSSVARNSIPYVYETYRLDTEGQAEQELRKNAMELPGDLQTMVHSLSGLIDSGKFTREQMTAMLDHGVLPHDTCDTFQNIEEFLQAKMRLESALVGVSTGLSRVPAVSSLKARSKGDRPRRGPSGKVTCEAADKPISIKSFMALLELLRYQTRNSSTRPDRPDWEEIRSLTQPDEARQLILSALCGMMSHSADTQQPPAESIMRLANSTQRLSELTHELDPANQAKSHSPIKNLTRRRFNLRHDYDKTVLNLHRAVDANGHFDRSMITAMLDKATKLVPPCSTDLDVTIIKDLLQGVMQLEDTITTLSTGLMEHHPNAKVSE